MTVVFDVGCARYGGDYSIERLIENFAPEVLYGFDPNASTSGWADSDSPTRVVVKQAAAWTFDGSVSYTNRGSGGTVMEDTGVTVPCVDLARFILEHHDDNTILKIDAEGAEYPLLEHLIVEGVDRLLSLAWVEWHSAYDRGGVRRRRIEETIGCELTEWRW